MASSPLDLNLQHYPITMKLLKNMKRGPTIMGTTQGDHATAYALVEQYVQTILSGQNPEENFYKMIGLISEIQEMQKLYRENYNSEISKTDRERMIAQEIDFAEKVDGALAKVQEYRNDIVAVDLLENVSGLPFGRDQFQEIIERSNMRLIDLSMTELAESYLLMRNRLFLAAFRKTASSPGSEEGAQIKNAKKVLMNASKETLETILEAVNATFYYPRISDRELVKSKAVAHRDNLIGKLVAVASNHISIIFKIFPKLESQKNAIIEGFRNNIIKEWKLEGKEKADFIAGIKEFIERPIRADESENIDDAALENMRLEEILTRSKSRGASSASDAALGGPTNVLAALPPLPLPPIPPVQKNSQLPKDTAVTPPPKDVSPAVQPATETKHKNRNKFRVARSSLLLPPDSSPKIQKSPSLNDSKPVAHVKTPAAKDEATDKQPAASSLSKTSTNPSQPHVEKLNSLSLLSENLRELHMKKNKGVKNKISTPLMFSSAHPSAVPSAQSADPVPTLPQAARSELNSRLNTDVGEDSSPTSGNKRQKKHG